VGAVILARVPGNRLGWVFAVVGVVVPFGAFQDVARSLLDAGVGANVVALGQAVADASWITSLFLMLVVVSAWFPDGRPPSPRWAWVVRVGALGWAVGVALALFGVEKQILGSAGDDVWLRNPIGIPGVPDFESSTLGGLVWLVILIAGAGSVVSLIVRFRRSAAPARLQIRWLMSSIAFVVLSMLAGLFFETVLDSTAMLGALWDVVFALSVMGIPVSAAVAITRYRLYDLGRLVNRTVTYGVVIGSLALLFAAGAVWLPQRVASTNDSLAVAAGTLVVLALFNPLRRRVQRTVDRHFNRLPYDPDRVSRAFAQELRDVIEPGEVADAWLTVSRRTLHPTTAAIWITPPDGR
jgi:hypothetical protein